MRDRSFGRNRISGWSILRYFRCVVSGSKSGHGMRNKVVIERTVLYIYIYNDSITKLSRGRKKSVADFEISQETTV